MAEDLPPNLDDGELWLPSDVIRAVGVCRHHHRRVPGRLPPFPEDCGVMDEDLAQKFASFGLLERRRALHAVKPFRDFSLKPELHGQGRPVFLISPAGAGYKVPLGQRAAAAEANTVSGGGGGGGTGAFFPVSRTGHKFHPGIPVDCQVEKFQLERARVFQRQALGHGLNRYVPARSSGSGRESGGTGVFLPRIATVESKKKPLSVKGNVQLHHRQPMWNPMLGKQAAKLLPSADMGLPHDWTY